MSGTTYALSSPQTINAGQQLQVSIEDFRQNNTSGGGSRISMSGVPFTIVLSDGSTFTVTMPACP